MRKLLLLLMVLGFMTFPVSAVFSDTFDNGLMTNWNPVVNWDVTSANSWDGSPYIHTSNNGAVTYATATGNYYTGVLADFGTDSNSNSQVWFRTDATNTNGEGIKIDYDTAGTSRVTISPVSVGSGVGFTFPTTVMASTSENWVKFSVTDLGNTLSISLYNYSLKADGSHNNTLLNTYNVADVPVSQATSIMLLSYNAAGAGNSGFDSIYISDVSSSSSNSITWSATDYLEGATETWNYAITDASWNDGSIKYVEIYKDGAIINPWTSCTLGICYDASYMTLQGQTGSQPLHLTAGVYTIYLKTGLLVGHTILSQASMTVYATAPSQMIVNTSNPSRTPFNIWLSTGYGHAVGQIRIDVEAKQGGDWILQRTFAITSDPGYNSMWVNAPGDYRVTLFDLTFGLKLITKYFSAVYVDVPIESNISTSNLTIEKTTFYYGDQLVGYYAIDNNNWTNGNTPYIAIRNTTSGIISAVYKVVVESQQKRFILGISDGNELPTNRYRPGNNTIELRAFNTTGDRLLDFKYFELADTDQDGNKLRLDKYKYCPNDKVLILASIPLQGYLTIANYNDLSRLLYNQSINGTDQSIVYKTKTPGNYLIRMLDYSGKQLRSADFVISEDCVAATATPTPATGTVAGQEAASLLSSKMFWAFMIIVGVMMFIVSKTKEYIPAGIAGITGLGIFTFMGWVPASIFFSVIVVTAYLLAKNQSKSETG